MTRGPEASFHSGQAQRPGRATVAIEHRGTHPPASLDDEGWIDRVPGDTRRLDSLSNRCLTVDLTPLRIQIHPGEIVVDVPRR